MPERLVFTVADGQIDHIDDVVDRLAAAGVAVEKVLRATGVIVGTCAGDRAALSDVDGISAVEPDREVRLAPPDSEVR